jgi:hypothetical protein
VINGNTTTVTKNGELSYEEVICGNTRTLTYSYGGGYREVVDGNTITITSLDGKREEVIDKQGNDVFLTLTGAYSFDDIEEAVPKLKFWNSDLRFKGKSGPDFSPIRPLFPRACGKTIGFWNRLEVSEKDRVKNTIDGITSGRLKDGKFYELIDYGR